VYILFKIQYKNFSAKEKGEMEEDEETKI